MTTQLERLDKLVGNWTTEATHPAMPGVVVSGTVEVEWLEGKRFLIHRARTDHPDFPDSISIIGAMGLERAEQLKSDAGRLEMHYYDSRGVSRVFDVSADDAAMHFTADIPGFAQRFTGTFSGDTLAGQWQINKDGARWDDDLQITYRRKS